MARQPHGIPIIYGDRRRARAQQRPRRDDVPASSTAAQGAAYDTRLARRELADATATDVRATGIHWDFAPVADIWRDVRWGRSYEPFSEAPLATGRPGRRDRTRARRRQPLRSQVASTTKHFTGYSAPDNGRDRENATLTERELWDRAPAVVHARHRGGLRRRSWPTPARSTACRCTPRVSSSQSSCGTSSASRASSSPTGRTSGSW